MALLQYNIVYTPYGNVITIKCQKNSCCVDSFYISHKNIIFILLSINIVFIIGVIIIEARNNNIFKCSYRRNALTTTYTKYI